MNAAKSADSARAESADPLAAALDVLGDRWSLRVLDALAAGGARFGEIEAHLGGIAPNVLSARLRQLADAGLVDAVAYSRRPVRLSYRLTERGAALGPVIEALRAWSADALGVGSAPVHLACGTPLASSWWCPVCERVVRDLGADAPERL
ncbi:MAG: helix-turn-helix transcriptional regulator [Acidimicrobiia bacterium]|nr:helix-turn-helix transcriptional regulator [Acidimicrobiia bacterium]